MNERLAWCELSEYCMVVWGDGMNYLICRAKSVGSGVAQALEPTGNPFSSL